LRCWLILQATDPLNEKQKRNGKQKNTLIETKALTARCSTGCLVLHLAMDADC